MFTNEEIALIYAAAKSGDIEVPLDIRVRIGEALKQGNQSMLPADDPECNGPNDPNCLCCDTGMSEPNRFQRLTFQNCKNIFNGTPADNDKCQT